MAKGEETSTILPPGMRRDVVVGGGGGEAGIAATADRTINVSQNVAAKARP
jgi:hypothetical protein